MAEAGQDEEEQTTFPLKRDFPAEEAIAKSQEDDVNKKQKLPTTTDSSLRQHNEIDVDEEDDDEDDYEGEDEEDDEEDSIGEAEVDRKGKGILRDDKGKGKLIEDSDDSSDFGSESDVDTDADLSDDLLAEVDLGNIIPSRTRRRTHQSSLKISDHPLKPDA